MARARASRGETGRAGLARRLARCKACGWKELFTRPVLASRAEASHRCHPAAARPRHDMRWPSSHRARPARPAEILAAAADAASRECSMIKAVDAGWATLSANSRHAQAALAAWARSEQYCGDLRGFGGFLRRRYQTAAQIDGSLRAAAQTAARPATWPLAGSGQAAA